MIANKRMKYVVGFIFSMNMHSVILIKKNKPEWQRGKLNGIGGKIELGESSIDAMVRECKEETGLNIAANAWTRFAHFTSDLANIDFYFVRSDALYDAKTMETEEIIIFRVLGLSMLNTIPNLQWLIPLAVNWDRQCHGGSKIDLVTITERAVA